MVVVSSGTILDCSATGVALNANQLGIGFAFVFGTLLVEDSNDVPGYFGLLSLLSTIVFIGTLIQFGDAPSTILKTG
jgi:hypothetical protein